MRKSLTARMRIAGVGVGAIAGLGLLGISAGPASAGSADVTQGAGGGTTAAATPSSVTETKYVATLEGCCEYHFNVFSNHLAKSSFIPPDGFKGIWTWSKNSGTGVITFQETNGSGCTWTAVKTSTGLNSVSSPGVAECSGTDYAWYAVKR
jgi:hypothetical protein